MIDAGPGDHRNAVEKVAASFANYYQRDESFKIYHGSTNSTRHTDYQREHFVDISPLSRVLEPEAALQAQKARAVRSNTGTLMKP